MTVASNDGETNVARTREAETMREDDVSVEGVECLYENRDFFAWIFDITPLK